MAKFIHLSLLLAATAQLTLVSVTKIFIPNGIKVTFKLPSNWTAEYCCRDDKCKFVEGHAKFDKVCVKKDGLIIHNPDEKSNGNYSCYGDSDPPINTDLLLCLKITGCQDQKSCSVEFSDHLHLTEDDCKGICLNLEGAAFKPIDNECVLESSFKNCQIELNTLPVSGDCFSNSYSGNVYQFYKEAKSWVDALEHCQNRNSSLVEILSSTVQASVNSSLLNKKSSMPNGAWIGLERSIFGKINVPWKWISGTEVDKECQPWNKSFPVDALNHHCGKIIWVEELKQFKWLDAFCHEELPFICQ